MAEPLPLREALSGYAPAGPDEAGSLDEVRAFVARKDAPFDRTDPEGHVVASGLVTSPSLDRVVLLHHRALDMWLQCGGHAEPGETDPRAIALREAREETGFDDLEPHPAWSGLIDVDVHEIPATETMPAHDHLDLRFLFVADPGAEPCVPEQEGHEVAWFPLQQARELDLDEGLQRLLWKVRSLRLDQGYEAQTIQQGSPQEIP